MKERKDEDHCVLYLPLYTKPTSELFVVEGCRKQSESLSSAAAILNKFNHSVITNMFIFAVQMLLSFQWFLLLQG